MAGALVAFLLLSLINFFPYNLWLVALGTFLQGLPCGMLALVAMNYAANVCPLAISDAFAAFIAMCWILGQTLSAAALWAFEGYANEGLDSDTALRVPLAVQWIIPVFVIPGCLWAPESPWWLAREGMLEDARVALERLRVAHVDEQLQMYQVSIHTEDQMNVKNTYKDCFRGSNRRRTEIAIMCSLGQLIAGFGIAAQVVYFFQFAAPKGSSMFMIVFSKFFPFLNSSKV